MMDNWRELATSLTAEVAGQGVKNKAVLEAMSRVPRHLFVPEKFRLYAYLNRPLGIGRGQTISQPYMVAKMTELLELKKGARVLEIGTGSGYQAALLAELGMEVITLERIAELALRAKKIFTELNYNISCYVRDGREGYPPQAPYQGIIVTAGAEKIEEAWLSQLSEGGKLVLPLAWEGGYRILVREKVKDKDYIDKHGDYCRFVPLLKGTVES
jgi:protein-L-isoaspartate(D-aspartate) O-methyltransferase